jgi:hypothetical protein
MNAQDTPRTVRTTNVHGHPHSFPVGPGRPVSLRAYEVSREGSNKHFRGEYPPVPPLYNNNNNEVGHVTADTDRFEDSRDRFVEERPNREDRIRQHDDRLVEDRPSREFSVREHDVVHRTVDEGVQYGPEEEQHLMQDRHPAVPYDDSFENKDRPPARAPFLDDPRSHSEGYEPEERNRGGTRNAADGRSAHSQDEMMDGHDPQDSMAQEKEQSYGRRQHGDDDRVRQGIRSPVGLGKGDRDEISSHGPSRGQAPRQDTSYGDNVSRSRGPTGGFPSRGPEYDDDVDGSTDYIDDGRRGVGDIIRGHQVPDYRGRAPGREPPVPGFGDNPVHEASRTRRQPVPSFNDGGNRDRHLDYSEEIGRDQGFSYGGQGLRSHERRIREPTVGGQVLRQDVGYGSRSTQRRDNMYATDMYDEPRGSVDAMPGQVTSRMQGGLRRSTVVLHRQVGPREAAQIRRPDDMERIGFRQPISRGPTYRGSEFRVARHPSSDRETMIHRHPGDYELTTRNWGTVRGSHGPSGRIDSRPHGRPHVNNGFYADDEMNFAEPLVDDRAPEEDSWHGPARMPPAFALLAEEIRRQEQLREPNYRHPQHQARQQGHPILQQPEREVAESGPMYAPRDDQVTRQQYGPLDGHRRPRNEQHRQGRPMLHDEGVNPMQPRHSSAQMEPPDRLGDNLRRNYLPQEETIGSRLTGPTSHHPRPRTSHTADGRPLLNNTPASNQVNHHADGQERAAPRAPSVEQGARSDNAGDNEDSTGLGYRRVVAHPQNITRPGDISVPNLRSGGIALSDAHLPLDPALGLLGTPTLDRDMLDLECSASFSSRFDVPAMLNRDSLEIEGRGSVDTELSSPSMHRHEREYSRQPRRTRDEADYTTKDYTDSDSPQE